jgi:cullin 1
MNLYTVAYNYCVSSRMHGNIDASVGLGGRSASLFPLLLTVPHDDGEADTLPLAPAGANLMGSDLYNNLTRYFSQHLRSLRDVRIYSLDVLPGFATSR